MWRPIVTLFRKINSIPQQRGTISLFYSTTNRFTTSTTKITIVSASVGILVGAGYGGYTHYKINSKKTNPMQIEELPFITEAPQYRPHYKIIGDNDNDHLHLVLFQYRTCPFCCKVRAYLDSQGFSYEIVEVDAVLRQAIRWSDYKKVPVLIAKVDGGYQQLIDSSAIISILETYIREKTSQLRDITKFYPISRYINDQGKDTVDITNKYFIMHSTPETKKRDAEIEEREWRQWADRILVHTLSPNVYRTASEALETFKWFEEVGGWRQSFPKWECLLMVYGGASAMWVIGKRLKRRHNIKDDVRQSLYDAANEWTSAVKKKGTRFLGGEQPNLADIAVFGILSSIEGCQAFRDLRKHSDVGKWFDDVKDALGSKQGKVVAINA